MMKYFQFIALLSIIGFAMALPSYRGTTQEKLVVPSENEEEFQNSQDSLIETMINGRPSKSSVVIVEELDVPSQKEERFNQDSQDEVNSLREFLRDQLRAQLQPLESSETDVNNPQNLDDPIPSGVYDEQAIKRLDTMGPYEKLLETFISKIMTTVLQAEIKGVRIEEMEHPRRIKAVQ